MESKLGHTPKASLKFPLQDQKSFHKGNMYEFSKSFSIIAKI